MSGADLFVEIRTAARQVADDAAFVRLRPEQVTPYAASLELSGLPEPAYDAEHHLQSAPAETVGFLLALDSVNFGSGYFPHLRKREGMSGYFTIASSLKEHWLSVRPLDGAALRTLRQDDCAHILGQAGNSGPVEELMTLFARALNDLGRWLGEGYDDDPLGPIAAADHSAARLVTLLAEMPFYQDVSRHRGRAVPLYKRAQLLAADLALAFAGRGPGAFQDLDELTIFADNLVPHVLRIDGLLDYDPPLLARIEHGEMIPAGSPEEVEIRAVALHAVERVVEELRQIGRSATARQLDYLLWNRGQGVAYKALPRHRTRSVYY